MQTFNKLHICIEQFLETKVWDSLDSREMSSQNSAPLLHLIKRSMTVNDQLKTTNIHIDYSREILDPTLSSHSAPLLYLVQRSITINDQSARGKFYDACYEQ